MIKLNNVFIFAQISVNVHCHRKCHLVRQNVYRIASVHQWVAFVVQIYAILNHVPDQNLAHKEQVAEDTKVLQVNI